MNKTLLIALLFLTACNTSKHLNNVPLSVNKVSFTKVVEITDNNLFEKSANNYAKLFLDSFIDNYVKKLNEENKPVDNAQLTLFRLSMKDPIKKHVIDERYKTPEKVFSYKESDSISMTYLEENELQITEFRNDIKPILVKVVKEKKGLINTFKIEVTVKIEIDIEDVNIPSALKYTNTHYTMYVTDKIKNQYHPVIKYKSILDKYYPLEIIEQDKNIEGAHFKYYLDYIEIGKN